LKIKLAGIEARELVGGTSSGSEMSMIVQWYGEYEKYETLSSSGNRDCYVGKIQKYLTALIGKYGNVYVPISTYQLLICCHNC
jgi:hypothetical protein